MIKSTSIATALCLLLAGSALAQEAVAPRASGPYLRLEAGISMPQKLRKDWVEFPSGNPANETFSKAPKSSFVGVVGLGYKLENGFRSDIAFEMRDHYGESFFDTKNKNSGVIINWKAPKIYSNALKLNLYFDILPDLIAGFSPYLGAGAGISFNRVTPPQIVEAGTFTAKYLGDNLTRNFAWSLTAGAYTQINEQFALNIAYSYNDLGKIRSSDEFMTEGKMGGQSIVQNELGGMVKGKLRTHEVRAGIRYNF